MKIGVSSYSFAQKINAGEMSQRDTVRLAAELGFEYIEFTDLTPSEGCDIFDYARALRSDAADCGIGISAYVVGADFSKKDNSAEVERIKRCVDVAAALGVKFFRHDIFFSYGDFRSFDEGLIYAAKSVREVAEYASGLGIKTMSENHGFICQDSDRMERFVNAVGHPNYGMLVDIGNFMCVDENPATAVSRVAKLAFFVHAKDFVRVDFADCKDTTGYLRTRGCNFLKGTSVGSGDVPVAQCVAILKNAGFDGHIDIEYEGEQDCIEGLKKGLEYLKGIVEM